MKSAPAQRRHRFADLLSRTGLTQEQRSYVELQLEAGKTLLSIINDILDFSKLEVASSTSPQRRSISRCYRKLRRLVRGGGARERGWPSIARLPRILPRLVELDGRRLQQILANSSAMPSNSRARRRQRQRAPAATMRAAPACRSPSAIRHRHSAGKLGCAVPALQPGRWIDQPR